MRFTDWRLLLLLLAALPACGGSSNDDGDDDAEPGPPFATTVNTGLAVPPDFADAVAVGRIIVTPVRELDMRADRNGDGDSIDDVVAAIDSDTGAITELGFAIVGPILTTGKTCAFLVNEAGQGRSDLNADNDTGDAVWFIYDVTRPIGANNPLNTGVATLAGGLPAIATDDGYVFLESEAAQGVDRNQDGDLFDNTVAAYQESVRSMVPVPPTTHANGTPLVQRNGRVLVAVSEPFARADLNRDGDAFDTVLFHVDFQQQPALVRVVGGTFPRAVATHPYALTDDGAVYMIDEATEGGTDLNGDGDALDAIVAVFAIGGAEFTPFSRQVPSFALAADPSRGIGTDAHRAVIAISEADQNTTDMNGDLDNFDAVVGWIDTQQGPGIVNLQPFALGRLPILVGEGRALVAISEKDDGAIVGKDHNNDGDIDDQVAFMLDMPTLPGVMVNLGFAVATVQLEGRDALIGVPENGHFFGDLNGNGLVEDTVTMYFDFSDSPPTMRGLGLVASASRLYRVSSLEVRVATLVPEGQSNTLGDLNGDGDQRDTGVLLLGIDPSPPDPSLLAPTPFFAGTGAANLRPPLRVDTSAFAFASSEDMLRVDLNGDGDMLDTVLQFTRYEPADE
ncbi:MAG: hypothetical protein ACYTGN_04305 [Planctomycetota bacterium]|jgi:hypothetical protein